jgi:hypothetical protein
MRLPSLLLYGVLLGAIVWSESATADILPAKANGWHTWQVDEPGTSTEMCCFAWKKGEQSNEGCNLDGHNISFSDNENCSAASGTTQIYVRMDGGTVKDIRILSSNCPVTTESAVSDHGLVSTDDNIRWFRHIIEDSNLANDVREEALFALVLSESDAAYAYLDGLLTSR